MEQFHSVTVKNDHSCCQTIFAAHWFSSSSRKRITEILFGFAISQLWISLMNFSGSDSDCKYKNNLREMSFSENGLKRTIWNSIDEEIVHEVSMRMLYDRWQHVLMIFIEFDINSNMKSVPAHLLVEKENLLMEPVSHAVWCLWGERNVRHFFPLNVPISGKHFFSPWGLTDSCLIERMDIPPFFNLPALFAFRIRLPRDIVGVMHFWNTSTSKFILHFPNLRIQFNPSALFPVFHYFF